MADLVALRSKAQRMADLWTGVVRLMEANKKTTFVIGINDAREVAVILEGIVSGREQASQAQVPAQGECGFEIWGECSSIAQKDSGANGIDSQQEDAPLTLPRYSRSDIETQTQAADEIARLREALEKARAQFQFYTEEHKAKSDTAFKAWDDARYWGNVDEQNVAHKEYHKRLTQTQTNRQFVEMIDTALQRKEPQS